MKAVVDKSAAAEIVAEMVDSDAPGDDRHASRAQIVELPGVLSKLLRKIFQIHIGDIKK